MYDKTKSNNSYKVLNVGETVDRRECKIDISNYTIDCFEQIFFQNLKIANFVVNGEYIVPKYSVFIDSFVYSTDVLLSEFIRANQNSIIRVLNACLFLFVSYYGEKYYSFIIFKYKY